MTTVNFASTTQGFKDDLLVNFPSMPADLVEDFCETSSAGGRKDATEYAAAVKALAGWATRQPIDFLFGLYRYGEYEASARRKHSEALEAAGVTERGEGYWIEDLAGDLSYAAQEAILSRPDNSEVTTFLRYLILLSSFPLKDDPGEEFSTDVMASFVEHLDTQKLYPVLRELHSVIRKIRPEIMTYRQLGVVIDATLFHGYQPLRAEDLTAAPIKEAA